MEPEERGDRFDLSRYALSIFCWVAHCDKWLLGIAFADVFGIAHSTTQNDLTRGLVSRTYCLVQTRSHFRFVWAIHFMAGAELDDVRERGDRPLQSELEAIAPLGKT